MEASGTWFFWALLSAVFAALTAVFAKIGLTGIDSDLATLVRTGIIAAVLAAFVAGTGKWTNPLTLPGKTLLFLLLSGLATGASWVCYFRALPWQGYPGDRDWFHSWGQVTADVPDTGNTMPAEALRTKDTRTTPSTATARA